MNVVYDHPPEIVRIAEKRVVDMIHNLRLVDYDLKRLMVSAYLQGVEDAALVAFKNGFVPPGCEFKDEGAGI